MKHRFAYLVFTGLALASQVVMSADSVRRPAGDIDILVNGTAQPRYAHQGRWYVEALKGREYAIRIRNPYGVRVAVALSVDGLNTIDARQTTAAAARKWVLGPYETVTISGWQASRTEARRFEFTTEARPDEVQACRLARVESTAHVVDGRNAVVAEARVDANPDWIRVGMTGYARIDLRMDEEGRAYVLEANPNPNLAYGEDFAESAETNGISYERLLERILTLGLRWEPERTG